jgi:hypothetical protein
LVKKLVINTIEAWPDNPINLKKGAVKPAIIFRIPKKSSKNTANETGMVSFSNQKAVFVPCGIEDLTQYNNRFPTLKFSVFIFPESKKAAH